MVKRYQSSRPGSMFEVSADSPGDHFAAMEDYDTLAAELADYKEMVDQYRIDHPKVEARAKALESDRDQISLTLDVAKADRDKWFNRARDLGKALTEIRNMDWSNKAAPTLVGIIAMNALGEDWYRGSESETGVDPTPEHQLKRGIRSGFVTDRAGK